MKKTKYWEGEIKELTFGSLKIQWFPEFHVLRFCKFFENADGEEIILKNPVVFHLHDWHEAQIVERLELIALAMTSAIGVSESKAKETEMKKEMTAEELKARKIALLELLKKH